MSEVAAGKAGLWPFLLVIDRAAFVFPLVVVLYFRLHLISPRLFVAGGVALVVFFLLTTPNRYGVSVALVYWARWRFGAENGSCAKAGLWADRG